MRRTLSTFALIGASALVLAGCAGGGKTDPSKPGALADGKTFTLALSADPGSLDPLTTTIAWARNVGRFLYGNLLTVGKDGKLDSALAEKWEGDTTHATFTIREGLTCEDGTPLTAKDIAENLQWAADPASKSSLIGMQVQAGSKAVGDNTTRTVTYTSSSPDAFLLYNLGQLPIVCGTVLHKPEELAKGAGATGMYQLTESVPNSQYTLTRRKDFSAGPQTWDPKQKGLPAKVVFRIITSETTAANLLTSGEINMATIAGPDRKRLQADRSIFRAGFESPAGELFFNQNDGRVLADPVLRKALVSGLDLAEVRKVLGGGEAKAPTGMVTVSPNPCRAEDTITGNVATFDATAAAALLDEAGWQKGSDGVRAKAGKKLSLTLLAPTMNGESFTAGIELIKASWDKLGIDVKLKTVDNTGLSNVLFDTGDWDVDSTGLTVNFPSTLVPFLSGAALPKGSNYSNIRNEEYSSHVAAAMKLAGDSGCKEWAAAESALVKNNDVIPYALLKRESYGKKATFAITDGIDPLSIRMYE